MERIKRSIFFWTLVALFLITAPLVVLYARGYRFDTNRGVFVHSGTITIKTNPQVINVKINDDIRPSKNLNRINNSYNLTGLIPGDYNIEISSPEFQTWRKKTDIHSGLATEFWNVVLVRKNYERTAYDTPGIEKFFTSPFSQLIAYTAKEENNLRVNIFDLAQEESVAAISIPDWNFIEEESANWRKENIEWSPEEDLVSIPVKKTVSVSPAKNKSKKASPVPEETQVKYHYLIANIEEETFFDLNDFLETENIRYVRWDPGERDYIFYLSGTDLYRANVRNKEEKTLMASDVTAFDLSRAGIFYVKKPNNLIFKKSLDGTGDPQQLTNDFPDETSKVISRVVVYDENRIAMLSQDKNFYSFNKGEHDTYFRKLGAQVEGMHYSDDGKKILFWSNNEISVYFVRDWEVQPVRAENEMTNITRFSEPVKNVQWFKDYEHIIFSSGRYTKIIEIDGRDLRNSMDLVNTELANPFVIINNMEELLYFTEKSGDSTTLNSIIFPEPVPVLGFGG